jgi:hypothetical protein
MFKKISPPFIACMVDFLFVVVGYGQLDKSCALRMIVHVHPKNKEKAIFVHSNDMQPQVVKESVMIIATHNVGTSLLEIVFDSCDDDKIVF